MSFPKSNTRVAQEITTAVTTPLPDTSPQAGVIAGQGVSRKQKTIDGTGGPSVDKTEDGPSTKDKKPPQRQVGLPQEEAGNPSCWTLSKQGSYEGRSVRLVKGYASADG